MKSFSLPESLTNALLVQFAREDCQDALLNLPSATTLSLGDTFEVMDRAIEARNMTWSLDSHRRATDIPSIFD